MKGFQCAAVALGLLLSSSGWAEDEPSEPVEEQRERADWKRDTRVQPIFHYGRFRADEDVYRHLKLGGEAALPLPNEERIGRLRCPYPSNKRSQEAPSRSPSSRLSSRSPLEFTAARSFASAVAERAARGDEEISR